ncbi:BTAD domain-containing putative transcriptional regulator [Kitasatospora sp. NPDC089797]|uniref:AfsR/SARP family transcriptional regulator n=1 Tax=Kitasatospora sp. NPDC089797 TaxID=3155298 RepID=UPI00341B4BE5
MRYGILGPFEVRCDDVPVAVPRPRQRAGLALLLLNADHPVSIDRMVDALWGDAPPRTARAQVHTVVSTLRRALPPPAAQALTLDQVGYRLAVPDEGLDAAEFDAGLVLARRLADRGRPAEAADRLRQALALWRGEALSGIDAPFAAGARARLDEQRFAAHELRADLELALGRHRELVPELTALAEEFPARESIAERAAGALYRCGRQADALAVVAATRRVLAEEYGLDPGARLLELERAILRHELPVGPPVGPLVGPLVGPRVDRPVGRAARVDTAGPGLPDRPAPVLAVPAVSAVPAVPGHPGLPAQPSAPPTPAQLPQTTSGFVGRREEIDRLAELSAAGPGASRIVALTGPAGVGKTSLALRSARDLAAHYPDGQIFVDLHGHDRDEHESPARALERLLLALGVPGPLIPHDEALREDLYRSTVAGRRLLVVLDDARDYEHVRPLLPNSPQSFTVVTSRGMLGGLVATTGAAPLRLAVLSPTDSVEVLGRIAGRERVAGEPEAAGELARLCGGLPLALRISAVRLAERPGLPLADLAAELAPEDGRLTALSLPDGELAVSRVLDHSYRRLGPDAARLLRLLGLHPAGSFAEPVAAALFGAPDGPLGASGASVRPLLRILESLHLIEPAADGRYRMHDLVRLYGRQLAAGEQADAAAARGRMSDWYLAVADAARRLMAPAGPHVPVAPHRPWAGPHPFEDAAGARAWFRTEGGNLLALTRLAASLGDHPATWQLATVQQTHLVGCHGPDALVETQLLGERAAVLTGDGPAAAALAAGLGIAFAIRRDPRARAYLLRAVTGFLALGDLRRAAGTRLYLGDLEGGTAHRLCLAALGRPVTGGTEHLERAVRERLTESA